MSYETVVYRRALERYEREKRERADRLAARYQAARAAVPGLRELDDRLRRTVARAAAAALSRGSSPVCAVDEQRRKNQLLQQERDALLRAAGFDPDALEDTPACALCGDAGWRGGAMCRCLRALCTEEQTRELSKLLDLGGQGFETFSLDWYGPHRGRMEDILELCRAYAARFPEHPIRNLYFYGKPGLGKTFLSACIARTVSERGFSVVYDTAGNIFSRFEDQKFGRDEEARDETRRYLLCDLLILDDLGSEMTTPFVQSALYTLLNTRLMAGRRTVLSSNLVPDGLEPRYTKQIVSRLRGEFRGLPFEGEDIRLQRKQGGSRA